MEGIATSLNMLGLVCMEQGAFERAREALEERLAASRAHGRPHGTANALANLAEVARTLGDFERAVDLLAECAALRYALRDPMELANAEGNLGGIAFARGDHLGALQHFREALRQFVHAGGRAGAAQVLEAIAQVCCAEAVYQPAVRLYGAAAALRAAAGVPAAEAGRHTAERNLTLARVALGEAAFRAAWIQGQAMPAEDAITYVLADDQLFPAMAQAGRASIAQHG
jgi:tetratricopeptide (TPR) repeat protein